MIKDTNPAHYKVEGANFIEYMHDPKISGFGKWMFANGFNSGVWASTNWISVKDRLPENCDTVLITHKGGVSFGWYNGRYWERGASTKHRKIRTVSHWMPLPEPPEEVMINDQETQAETDPEDHPVP